MRAAPLAALLLTITVARSAFGLVDLKKKALGTVAHPGGTVAYELDFSRTTFTETGVVIHDPLPAGHQLLTVSAGGATLDCTKMPSGMLGAGLSATCNAGGELTIAVADTEVAGAITVTYRLAASASGMSVNRAQLACSQSCSQSAMAETPIAAAPLHLVKTASAPSVMPGGTLDYTLTLDTTGAASDVAGDVVRDTVPAGVTVTQIDTPVPIANVTLPAGPGTAIAIAPTGPLPPGMSFAFVLHCTIDKGAALGTLTNLASAQAPGGQPVNAQVAVQVSTTAPSLALSKTVDRASAKIGDTVTYTLGVTPSAPQPGPIVLTDPIDPALAVVGVRIGNQAVTCGALPAPAGSFLVSCGTDGRHLSIELPAGQTLTTPLSVQVSARVQPLASSEVQNLATLTDAAGRVQQKSVGLAIENGATGGATLLLTAGKLLAEKADLVPFVATVGVPANAAPIAQPMLLFSSSAGLQVGDVRLVLPNGSTQLVRPTEQNGGLVVPLPALPAGSTLTATARARVTGRAKVGGRESFAAQLSSGSTRLAGALATVRIVPEPEFDLGTLVGDVFRDDNGNGVRDPGERGIAGALVVMDDGLQAVTDTEGRYHLAAIVPGDRAIKLAKHTLPPGSSFTTDETRIVDVTPGILLKVDFGVKVPAPEPPLLRPAPVSWALPELTPLPDGRLGFRLIGQAEPGARVQLCEEPRARVPAGVCHPAEVDRKSGAFSVELALTRGRNRFAEVTAWPDGRVVVAAREIFWVERQSGGSLILPRPAEPRLTLRFPASALADPTFTLEGAATRPLAALTIAGQPLVPDRQGRIAIKLKLPSAQAPIAIDARFADGLSARFDHLLTAGGDYFLLVGLAEAKGGYVEREGAAGQSGLFAQGRVKLYAKGRIQGRWLLEGGLDIDSDQISSWRDLFRGDPTKVFRNLDPDRYYPVYGDSSQTTQAAQTRGRLYVRIQIDRSELLFGNFQTGLTGVEFGQYSRAVTGGRISYVRASTRPDAPPDTQVILFGAWLETARAHDELRGTGGSLYYLSHRDVVEGSEQVRIEVRDRISDRPISNLTQHATIDYEVDYLSGRIVLRDPLSSVAAAPSLIRSGALDGDRAYLVVDYEYIVDGDLDDGAIGARATQRLGPVRLGGTVASEIRAIGGYTLVGADLQIDLKKWGTILGEYAHSYGSLSSFARSDDGGLSYANAEGANQALAAKREGNAWKGEADLHLGSHVSLHPYARGVDQGYTDTAHAEDAGFVQWGMDAEASFWRLRVKAHYDERRYQESAGALPGTPLVAAETRRDIGGEVGMSLGRFTLRLGARTERADDTDAAQAGHRTAIGGRIDVRLVDRLTVYGAGQYALEHGGGDGLLGVDNTLVAVGFISDLGWQTRLITEVNAAAPFGARNLGGRLSLRTETGPGRVIYGTVTLSQDRDDRLATTVAAGGRERIVDRNGRGRASLFAEDQFRDGPVDGEVGGRAHVLATGVDVPLSKRFVFGATFERGTVDPSGSPLANSPPIDRTAGTLYASYGGSKLRVQAKGELRSDDLAPLPSSAPPSATIPTAPTATGSAKSALQWLASGMITWRPRSDLTLRGKIFFSRSSDPTNTLARSDEVTAGFAWRPSFTDRVALFGRYTYLDEFAPLAQAQNGPLDPVTGQPLGFRERAHVMSLAAAGRIIWRFSLAEKIAAKLRDEPELGTSSQFILWVNRLSFHVTRRWDAVAEYRLLDVPGTSLTHGVSVEANVIVVGHLRLGAGWNFSDFSDNELTLGRGSEKGFYVHAEGFY